MHCSRGSRNESALCQCVTRNSKLHCARVREWSGVNARKWTLPAAARATAFTLVNSPGPLFKASFERLYYSYILYTCFSAYVGVSHDERKAEMRQKREQSIRKDGEKSRKQKRRLQDERQRRRRGESRAKPAVSFRECAKKLCGEALLYCIGSARAPDARGNSSHARLTPSAHAAYAAHRERRRLHLYSEIVNWCFILF